MWFVLTLLFLLALLGSLVALICKTLRRKAKWALLLSLAGVVICYALFTRELDESALQKGFLSNIDLVEAEKAGISDPVIWRKHKEEEEAKKQKEEAAAQEQKEEAAAQAQKEEAAAQALREKAAARKQRLEAAAQKQREEVAAAAQKQKEEAAATAQKQKEEAAISLCRSDWNKCADNAQLANNNLGYARAQRECKSEATERARYGTPVWLWFSFSTFYKGKEYTTTGTAILIEPDAQFSNAFGAMAHSTVICTYDLRTERVINIDVSPH